MLTKMLQNETHDRMTPRLAIIADDITGSFDTGVQFQKRGAAVKVALHHQLPEQLKDVDVLVIDAETRHASAEETYARTRLLAAWTVEMQIPYLYIKTDSGLRGHIGMAIKAAMDATGSMLAGFAPAYPDMDRITLGGQQLIGGVPLQNSVFGQDLFDPVNVSCIGDLLAPAGVAVRAYPRAEAYDTRCDEPTIAVFDTVENSDFDRIAAHLQAGGQLRVTAGCAAFASRLPGVMDLPNCMGHTPDILPPLMVVCGSLNPITRAQMEYGEGLGHIRQSMSLEQLMDPDYLGSSQGKGWLAELGELMDERRTILLDTGLKPPAHAAEDLCATRVCIARQLGRLMQQLILLDEDMAYTPMIIGGDTLMGFLGQLEKPDIMLEGEVVPGVVSFWVNMAGRRVRMLSKSGGFGSPTLLRDVLSVPMYV